MLNKSRLQQIFGISFYSKFKGLEKNIEIIRDHKLFDNIRGVITTKELILPPSKSISIKDGDIVNDGFNKFVVIHIQNEGPRTVWQIRLERLSKVKYKRRVTKQVITNRISNGTINQNVGSRDDIRNNKDMNNYSVKDIAKIIPKVDIDDQKQLLQLETIFNNIKKGKEEPKKGFLKKFDSLLGKYPNIINVASNLLLQWAETGFMH